MPRNEVVAAFDQISAVYDETRDPLDSGTLDAISADLRSRGIRTILEVGVGTGRIALPLLQRGFEVTGLDASRAMLSRAHSKGIARLVRGDAYRLPFEDGAFDTALFVHVLHLLDNVPGALSEAERVGRSGVTGLVHPSPSGPPTTSEMSPYNPRRIMYRYLEKEGYPPPAHPADPRSRERLLLAEHPPDRLVVVSDREVTEHLAKRIEMLERRGSRHTLHIPAEVVQRAAAAARAEIGDRTFTYRRIEALATWSKR